MTSPLSELEWFLRRTQDASRERYNVSGGERLTHPVLDSTTVVKATELRSRMRAILEQARFQGERFLVCTHGQPMAVLMGVDEYLQLEASAEERVDLPPAS